LNERCAEQRSTGQIGRAHDRGAGLFARHPGLHSLGSLQESLGYPKSSLYVLLRTLVDVGWIETDATGTLYRIGLRALLVGTSYIDSDDVVAGARSALDRLAEETGETCHLARLDGSDVVYLATRESHHYLRPFSRIGRRLPHTRPRSARHYSPIGTRTRCGRSCRRSSKR